jgi:membrane protein implicated in regulation of membrane protease activity
MCALHTATREYGAELQQMTTGPTSLTLRAVDAWVLWIIAAVVLAVAEVLTLTFVLAMIAGGCAAGAIAAAVGANATGQWIVFGVVDVVLLASVLPLARRHLRQPSELRSGAARLVGSRAMSLTAITTAEGGRVKLEGNEWSARPYADGTEIPAGQWVEVVKIDGATALVQPIVATTS